jgi:hypothetical protein
MLEWLSEVCKRRSGKVRRQKKGKNCRKRLEPPACNSQFVLSSKMLEWLSLDDCGG